MQKAVGWIMVIICALIIIHNVMRHKYNERLIKNHPISAGILHQGLKHEYTFTPPYKGFEIMVMLVGVIGAIMIVTTEHQMSEKNLTELIEWVSEEENAFLLITFTATCILLGLGLTLPMMTLTKFVFFGNTFSLFSSLVTLLSSGSLLLFLIIFVFSVVTPLLKLRYIYVLIKAKGRIDTNTKHWLHLMHEFGRWSMLDVFVVAVIIAAVKLGVMAKANLHIGLYCFGLAILMMMILTHLLSKIYEPKL